MKMIRRLLRPIIRRTLRRGEIASIAPFTADMTIEQAWNAHRDAPSIFAQHHLPSCDSCSVRFDERLEEAAAAYGIDLDGFLSKLNALRL